MLKTPYEHKKPAIGSRDSVLRFLPLHSSGTRHYTWTRRVISHKWRKHYATYIVHL
ncbi:hypothetical protein EMIT0196MI5_230024 [Pseudomonas sp. IT-196MI5]